MTTTLHSVAKFPKPFAMPKLPRGWNHNISPPTVGSVLPRFLYPHESCHIRTLKGMTRRRVHIMPDISNIMIEKTQQARLRASIPGPSSNANPSPSTGIEATTCMDDKTRDTLVSMNAKGGYCPLDIRSYRSKGQFIKPPRSCIPRAKDTTAQFKRERRSWP